MSEYKAVLSRTLEGIDESYESAMEDLRLEIGELAEAVADLSKEKGEEVSLSLDVQSRSPDGTVFRLRLTSPQESATIEHLRVTPQGYPIEYGDYVAAVDRFLTKGNLTDYAALKQRFTDILSNKSSPFVVLLGYFLEA